MIEFPKCRLPTITFEQILRVLKFVANACATIGLMAAAGAVGGIIAIAGMGFFVSPVVPLLAKVAVGGFVAYFGGRVTAWACR